MAVVRSRSGSTGRPKQPIAQRASRSKRPHKNRISPPDLPMEHYFDLDKVPVEPPEPLNELERKCWDEITEHQRGSLGGRWIYRSDCTYLISACKIYGRWRAVEKELNEHLDAGGKFFDIDTGKVTPLLDKETNLNEKFRKSLEVLGLCPGRRYVTAEEKVPMPDPLIAH